MTTFDITFIVGFLAIFTTVLFLSEIAPYGIGEKIKDIKKKFK